MKFGRIGVTLVGVTPLLMNRMDIEALKKRGRSTLKAYDIEKEAAKAAYMAVIDGRQQLYVPAVNVYTMILQTSGRGHKIDGKSARSILAGLMKVEPETIPLGTDKYEIDVRTVVIKGARVVKARPLIRDWVLNFEIAYESNLIANPDVIKDILEEAGFRTGLLDYRPQHLGPFGTFTVEKFEVTS